MSQDVRNAAPKVRIGKKKRKKFLERKRGKKKKRERRGKDLNGFEDSPAFDRNMMLGGFRAFI